MDHKGILYHISVYWKDFKKGTRQRALTKIALIWDTKAEKVKNTKMAVVSTKRNSSTSLLLLQYDYHNEVPLFGKKSRGTDFTMDGMEC